MSRCQEMSDECYCKHLGIWCMCLYLCACARLESTSQNASVMGAVNSVSARPTAKTKTVQRQLVWEFLWRVVASIAASAGALSLGLPSTSFATSSGVDRISLNSGSHAQLLRPAISMKLFVQLHIKCLADCSTLCRACIPSRTIKDVVILHFSVELRRITFPFAHNTQSMKTLRASRW